jgi:hypothetical protein
MSLVAANLQPLKLDDPAAESSPVSRVPNVCRLAADSAVIAALHNTARTGQADHAEYLQQAARNLWSRGKAS